MIIKVILYIVTFLLVFPPIATLLAYKIAKALLGNQRAAVHQATYWTALLYVISVTYMLSFVFHIHAAGYMLAFLLLFFMVMLFLQYKYAGEIVFRKVVKLFLRATFLLFFCLYFLVVIVGITMRIF